MRVIIAGSRTITGLPGYAKLVAAIAESGFDITHVISGGAKGIDSLAVDWAKSHGRTYEEIKPDWSLGKWAGFARNTQMAYKGDALLAVWDGESKGTKHMIGEALKRGLPIHVFSGKEQS